MDTIQPLENINVEQVCRACFETCEQYKMLLEDAESIEKRTLGDIFSDVVKIENSTNTESSPSRICLPCSNDLISAYNFIQKSKQNNDRFLEYLKSTSIKPTADCLSEFPIDIPNNTNVDDFLQIKVENETICEYTEPLLDDKISTPCTSDSEGSNYDEPPSHEESKFNKMQCTYCNRIFKRLDFLENHKRKHEEELKKKEESGETSLLLCDECGASCSSKHELKTHRMTHHSARVMSSERESSESSTIQINSIDKCDGFFRRRCPMTETSQHPQQTISRDGQDILMLKSEISDLRETCLKEFNDIKELILQQSYLISKDNNHKPRVKTKDEEAEKIIPVWQFDKLFPINTEDELNALNGMDEDLKLVAISTLRQLIYNGGLCPNMKRVFGNRIIVNYNYEGKRGKKSLKDLTNVNDILFRAAFKHGYTMEDYENDLRKGFKIMKNRFFKNECIKRKKTDVNPDMKNIFIEIND